MARLERRRPSRARHFFRREFGAGSTRIGCRMLICLVFAASDFSFLHLSEPIMF